MRVEEARELVVLDLRRAHAGLGELALERVGLGAPPAERRRRRRAGRASRRGARTGAAGRRPPPRTRSEPARPGRSGRPPRCARGGPARAPRATRARTPTAPAARRRAARRRARSAATRRETGACDRRGDVPALEQLPSRDSSRCRGGARVEHDPAAERRLAAQDTRSPRAATTGSARRSCAKRSPSSHDPRGRVRRPDVDLESRAVGDRLELLERDVEPVRDRVRARRDERLAPRRPRAARRRAG